MFTNRPKVMIKKIWPMISNAFQVTLTGNPWNTGSNADNPRSGFPFAAGTTTTGRPPVSEKVAQKEPRLKRGSKETNTGGHIAPDLQRTWLQTHRGQKQSSQSPSKHQHWWCRLSYTKKEIKRGTITICQYQSPTLPWELDTHSKSYSKT